MKLQDVLPTLPKYTGRPDLYERFMPRGGVVLEIGCWKGHNALNILTHAHPDVLHLVDPLQYEGTSWTGTSEEVMRELQTRMFPYIRDHKVIVHQGFSQDVLSLFHGKGFSWAYVDGNHNHEACLSDLESCALFTGLIGVHDLQYPAVVKAIEVFCDRWPLWSPVAHCLAVPNSESDPTSSAESVVLRYMP